MRNHTRKSTKIEDIQCGVSSVISPFSRNEKLCKNVIMKTSALAPIEVEILLCRGSAQKIVTDSGISS